MRFGPWSQDSDCDVRFVYVRSLPWYLQIDAGRDVIEKPISDELDISGRELRKTLGLLYQSNPALLEWLQSPVVYRKTVRKPCCTRMAKSRCFT